MAETRDRLVSGRFAGVSGWLLCVLTLLTTAGSSCGAIWSGGGGTDTFLSASSNWTGSTPPPFDGSASAVFGSGGDTATINIPAAFSGIYFNRDGNFTLAAGAGALSLGAGGLAAAIPNTTSRTYTVAEDVTLSADQTWAVTNNTGITTVTVSGRIGDGGAAYGITRTGDGTLELSGDNTYSGTTVVKSNAILRITHSNALGSPSGATTVESTGRLEVSGGISVTEPLFLSGQGPGNGGVLNNSGNNTLGGLITLGAGSTRINAGGGSSTLTVSGGITSAANPFFVFNTGGGIIQITGNPVTIGSGTLWSDQSGTIVFGTSGNSWGNTVIANVTMKTALSGALPPSAQLSMSSHGRVDLNGFSQTVAHLQASDNTGCEVTSETPATLTLNQTSARVFDGALTGALGLTINGTGSLTLSNALNTMTGDLVLNGGTLTVSSNSCVGRSSNIVVNGGTLALQNSRSIRNTASLRVADGGAAKVNVATGVVEQVAQLYFGAVRQTNGTWGATGSGADHIDNIHFNGGGRILVAGAETGIIRDFYVAANGSATNAGTLASPFGTLEQARDAVRLALLNYDPPAGGVTVWLRGGIYQRTNTFDLSVIDSGSAESPIVYRAYPGETVRIHGAQQLQPGWFSIVSNSSPVWARIDATARGNVMQVDLPAHGISDFGTLRKRNGGSTATLAGLELVFDGVAQEFARWPDTGRSGADSSNGFAYTVSPSTSNTFTYTGNRPALWTQAEELWFHGFWGVLWYDEHIRATAVDTNSHAVTLSLSPGYGITNSMPFYAENLLEEITTPGEWYLNRSTGILYFWPPVPPAGHDIQVSMLEVPLVRLTGVRNVTWQDITLEGVRGDLFAITGGASNRILNCTLRNAGNYGVKITGVRNGVSGCEIYGSGDGGISMTGGDRATLTGAGNYVRNCTIHGFGRWDWMYTPAVNINAGSVGHVVAHNVLYDSPHTAIGIGGGNYHLVEFNEVRDVCKWSSDAGSIYTGRDLGAHGSIIRNNFVHDIAGQFGAGYGTHGIYLDDCIAGIEVSGNICYKVAGMGIQHGGGRDDLMLNNVLVKCGRAMGPDTRGLTWDMSNTWANVQLLPYRGAIWSNAFPQLTGMPTNWTTVTNSGWLAPYGTVFSRNIGYSNTVWVNSSATSYYREVANNLTNSNPLFVDEAGLDLTLRTNSPAFTIPGFVDIPFSRIGLESNGGRELAVWDFPTAAERTGFSSEMLVNPSELSVGGLSAFATPGHPTWSVSVSNAEMSATNESGAVAAGEYYEVTVAPAGQDPFSLETLTFSHRKNGAGAGATLFLRSSADGYASTLGSTTTTGSNEWNTATFDLSGVAAFGSCATGMTLRLYCYKPAGDNGTQTLSIDNISVRGNCIRTTDANTNAISDAWELANFAGLDVVNGRTQDDWDGDGMNNFAEYKAGTSPTNRNSLLSVSLPHAVSAGETNLVIEWSSVAGRFYAIQTSTNLFTGFDGWAASHIPATQPLNTRTVPVDQIKNRYYKVLVEQ